MSMAKSMFKNNKKHMVGGFTLIEILIVIAIFSMVVAISMSSLSFGYTSGKTKTVQEKKINRDLNLILDTIRYKMQNANVYVPMNEYAPKIDIWGFNVNQSSKMLAIATAATMNQCTFIGFDSATQAIWMLQENCKSGGMRSTVDTAVFKRMTSKDVNITDFSLTPSSPLGTAYPTQLIMQITATDINGNNEAIIKNTYNLSYQTIMSF